MSGQMEKIDEQMKEMKGYGREREVSDGWERKKKGEGNCN